MIVKVTVSAAATVTNGPILPRVNGHNVNPHSLLKQESQLSNKQYQSSVKAEK